MTVTELARGTAYADAPDLDQQLKEDMERMRQAQGGEEASKLPAAQPAASSRWSTRTPEPNTPLENVKDAVDKVLIADFFFVLFALGWLGVALLARSALDSTVG